MAMTNYLYILGTVLFTVYGQLIIKWRIVNYTTLPNSLKDKLLFLFQLLFDPYIFSGLFSAFIASLFWMAAMTKLDLSHAYPIVLGGLAILTSAGAILFFKEPLTVYKIIGTMLIISGACLIREAGS